MKQTIWLNSIYLIIDTLLVKCKMIPRVYIESMVCFWSRHVQDDNMWHEIMEQVQEEAQISDLQPSKIP